MGEMRQKSLLFFEKKIFVYMADKIYEDRCGK
jgi:hypothetical protein